MTKAKTAGAKKRAKKGRIPIAGIPRVAQTNGRATPRPERPSAALRSALIARARLAGIDVPIGDDGKPKLTAELTRRLVQPWMGCNAGRSIEMLPASERSQLWDVICGVRRAYARYWRAIGIPSPYPPASRLLYADEPQDEDALPTEAGWTREVRTVDEEARAATIAMMLIDGKLSMVPWAKRVILHDDQPVRDRDEFAQCLRSMA